MQMKHTVRQRVSKLAFIATFLSPQHVTNKVPNNSWTESGGAVSLQGGPPFAKFTFQASCFWVVGWWYLRLVENREWKHANETYCETACVKTGLCRHLALTATCDEKIPKNSWTERGEQFLCRVDLLLRNSLFKHPVFEWLGGGIWQASWETRTETCTWNILWDSVCQNWLLSPPFSRPNMWRKIPNNSWTESGGAVSLQGGPPFEKFTF